MEPFPKDHLPTHDNLCPCRDPIREEHFSALPHRFSFLCLEVVREKPAQIPRLLLKKFVPSIPLHFNLRSLRIRPPFSEFSVTLVCCFQFGGTFQLLFAIFSTTFLRRSETWRASAFDAAVSPAAFASARFLSLTFDSASSAAILSALAMTSCMFPTI